MSAVRQTADAEFDVVAPRYDATVEDSIHFSGKGLDFFTQAKVDQLVGLGTRLIGDLGERCILDVGCGNGSTDAMLAPAVATLHGVDVSSEMVAEAARRNPAGRYATYDGTTLPFGDDTFDIAFAICVMHHVPPFAWNGFCRELLRVTRPGGLAMVFEHNPHNPLTRRAVRNCPFDAEAVLLRRSEVTELLCRAGGVVAAQRYILFTPFDQRAIRQSERLISWMPLGAQYVVAVRPPAGSGPVDRVDPCNSLL